MAMTRKATTIVRKTERNSGIVLEVSVVVAVVSIVAVAVVVSIVAVAVVVVVVPVAVQMW